MLGHIQRSADFERVLATPPRSRSTHFAAHHLPDAPSRPRVRPKSGLPTELSTDGPPAGPALVDDLPAGVCWLGVVVPKRHARRAVTRNLIKRQMREAVGRSVAVLPPGLWVLRLKSGFDLRQFPSAASDALRAAVRVELGVLLNRVGAGSPRSDRGGQRLPMAPAVQAPIPAPELPGAAGGPAVAGGPGGA